MENIMVYSREGGREGGGKGREGGREATKSEGCRKRKGERER